MANRAQIKGAPPTAATLLLQQFGILAGLLLVLLASGCATTEMKGTPFYTGEYSKPKGPAEQRVNIWPLFYYREPALSVLWPVFELTEDHAAVRPLFSVYGLDEAAQQYNVLWPLAQFDQRTGDHHIVPVFWGDDYFVLFPLYWHCGEPWSAKGGLDALLPLWYYRSRGANDFNLYSPWPLVRVWSDPKAHESGSMVLPLYWQQRTDQLARFYSPLWWQEQKADGDFWRLLLPLYFQRAQGNDSAFVSLLWAQGHSGQSDWRAMFPFWYYGSDGAGGFDFSAPWPLIRWWADKRTGAHGRQILPLYYQSSNALSSLLITPLWAQGHTGTTDWDVLVPLWYRSWEGTNRFSLYAPLAHVWSDAPADDHGSTVIPFYYYRNQKGAAQFTSLLWFNHTKPNGDYWRLLPPLFYQEASQSSSMLITPLWAQGRSATNDWTAIIPFGYWDRQQHSLFSPLWAHWWVADTETWLAPWTLSWWSRSPERSDLTLLGGLARSSWGTKPGTDYVIPLYYNNPETGTLLSPVWFAWRDGETKTTVAPWLLSWKETAPRRTDLWLAGGLARASWGEAPGADYVIPLFYHDAERLLTPLVGWDEELGYRYFTTPLVGQYTGQRSGGWVFPLYSHSRGPTTGAVKDRYAVLGGYTKTPQRSSSWFIPLYFYENRFAPQPLPETGAHRQTYGQSFWGLPFCWYKNQCHLRPANLVTNLAADAAAPNTSSATNRPLVRDYTRSHGVFPLWSYSAQTTPTENRSKREGDFLLWLYDYQHALGPGAPSGATNDYTRSRVLWRLWHYEKLNGAVSVDVFPSFTYDCKPDGFKKVSVLWRFFRYERAASGAQKLDVLFVPLQR